jgi:hypothetical protein
LGTAKRADFEMTADGERLRIKANEIRERSRTVGDPDLRRYYALPAKEYDHVDRPRQHAAAL